MVVYIMGELLSWAGYWAHFERRQRESVCRCMCVYVGADRITLSNFLTESSNRVGSMPGRGKGPFFSSSTHEQKRQCPFHLCVHSIANQCAGACVPCLCRYGYKFSKKWKQQLCGRGNVKGRFLVLQHLRRYVSARFTSVVHSTNKGSLLTLKDRTSTINWDLRVRPSGQYAWKHTEYA